MLQEFENASSSSYEQSHLQIIQKIIILFDLLEWKCGYIIYFQTNEKKQKKTEIKSLFTIILLCNAINEFWIVALSLIVLFGLPHYDMFFWIIYNFLDQSQFLDSIICS